LVKVVQAREGLERIGLEFEAAFEAIPCALGILCSLKCVSGSSEGKQAMLVRVTRPGDSVRRLSFVAPHFGFILPILSSVDGFDAKQTRGEGGWSGFDGDLKVGERLLGLSARERKAR